MAWLDERNITPMPMKDLNMDPSMKAHHMERNRELFLSSSTDGGHTFTPKQRGATNAARLTTAIAKRAVDGWPIVVGNTPTAYVVPAHPTIASEW